MPELKIAVGCQIGARPWADPASAELRATGERARHHAPDTADKLTAQELQVAQLIIEGGH